MNSKFWRDRKVFLSGHTGFKGSWLGLWLASMGAEVNGFALPPESNRALFSAISLKELLANSRFGDVRNISEVSRALEDAKPSIVFHLAAQPLVLRSYRDPIETFDTNVMGTVNILNACRSLDNLSAIVVVTSDKCYENYGWAWPYRETDRLGGDDPYSASKACTELVSSAFYNSYFRNTGTQVATVRAGNVIGGGDWSEDRLIPDAMRALGRREALKVRSPDAVRPWQHVLEPLSGYLMLAAAMGTGTRDFSGAWNFGPNIDDCKSVEFCLRYLTSRYSAFRWDAETQVGNREAKILKVDSSKARAELGWRSKWSLPTALEKTCDWYDTFTKMEMGAKSLRELCAEQIADFSSP